MPIAFYTDEHISHALILGVRQRGIDVLTVPEAGMIGASDEAQLERANGLGRVFYTNDRDLLRLHARGVEHAGLVYAPRTIRVGDAVHGLVLVHGAMLPEEMQNHLEYL